MAFNTFANLKQEIIETSGRDDLSASLDGFIKMAESEMVNNSSQPLRLRVMEIRSTANTNGTRFLELPPRFLQMRRLTIDTNNGKRPLEQRATTSMVLRSGVGKPQIFSVTSQLGFDVVPDKTYEIEMNFYQQPQALSDSNTSNDILAGYPQIYLHGALFHLWIFAKEDEFASTAGKIFMEGIKGANEADKKGRYGAAPVSRVFGSVN